MRELRFVAEQQHVVLCVRKAGATPYLLQDWFCVELNPGPAAKPKRTRKHGVAPGQHVDLLAKGRMIGMHEAGVSIKEVARRVPADKNTVKRTIREYEMTGGVATHHGGGWKRKLDRKECERVMKKAKKKKSARQIADEYARDTERP